MKKKKKRKKTTVIWNIALYFNGATRTERIFFNALRADEMVALLARQTVSFLFRLVRYTKFIQNGNSISKHCQQWNPIFFLRHFFFFCFFFSRFTRGSPPRFDYESACHAVCTRRNICPRVCWFERAVEKCLCPPYLSNLSMFVNRERTQAN